jgi:hypothetical protein
MSIRRGDREFAHAPAALTEATSPAWHGMAWHGMDANTFICLDP